MKLTLGFSPCPNDTFIFAGIAQQKVDTEGLEFELVLEDIETLNQMAFLNELNVTKLSYHALAHLLENYKLLDAGSALGQGVGPLLIAKAGVAKLDESIQGMNIAIPGKYTTANFLLHMAFTGLREPTEVIFSQIESAVLSGEVDAGVIIHENRFTYEERGLVKLIDLGEYWENTTKLPIPLGGIGIQRQLPRQVQLKVGRVLKRSIGFASKNRLEVMPYVREHAQEMDEEVIRKHISLYVNDLTLSLGKQGRKAVDHLLHVARLRGLVKEKPKSEVYV